MRGSITPFIPIGNTTLRDYFSLLCLISTGGAAGSDAPVCQHYVKWRDVPPMKPSPPSGGGILGAWNILGHPTAIVFGRWGLNYRVVEAALILILFTKGSFFALYYLYPQSCGCRPSRLITPLGASFDSWFETPRDLVLSVRAAIAAVCDPCQR